MARPLKSTLKKRGRPPSSPDLVRNQRVVTFVTPSEMDRLHQLAETEQITLSAAVHGLIKSGLPDVTETKT
jgi:hypothetical protein